MQLVGMVSLYYVSVSKLVSSARFARSVLGPLAQGPGPLGPGAPGCYFDFVTLPSGYNFNVLPWAACV